MNNDQMDAWMPRQEQSTLSIEGMETLIKRLSQARAAYDVAKKASNQRYHELEEVEKEVMGALKTNGRTKFEAEGVALVYIVSKEVYSVPKNLAQKQGLFSYIQNKYGDETLLAMLGINHNTLNSWANKEIESDPSLTIPGLEAPTSVETLNFRSKA